MRLETERLVLRLPRLEDADGAYAYLGDAEAMRFIGDGSTVPRAAVGEAIEKWLRRWTLNGYGQLAVERREDGAFVGLVGLNVWDSRTWRISTRPDAGGAALPELGWKLARTHWGNGYATEAARAARDWARGELGLGRLVSIISPGNVRSIRVAERLGARPGETIAIDAGPAVVWEHPR